MKTASVALLTTLFGAAAVFVALTPGESQDAGAVADRVVASNDVPTEAPAGFDNESNGLTDPVTHEENRSAFDEVEFVEDGLGPVYNAQACRECHQNPTTGGISQVAELRAGYRDRFGRFVNPDVPINNGSEIIRARSLINDRAICPSADFPDAQAQMQVPPTAQVRTFRTSLNTLGDGFVEALASSTLLDLADEQCRNTHGAICGQAVMVPVLEAQGALRVGRFGWKNQHASLLSFSADAYLNEMGITSSLQPAEVTTLCDTVPDPEDDPNENDIEKFAQFMRASKAPPRDEEQAATSDAQEGSGLFDRIGCAHCHVRTLVTAPAGTVINAGALTVPPALGSKIIHPFSDFLLHDVGTGDGIVQNADQRTGRKMRTPPLWGVRTRTRLLHDGSALTLYDAIARHGGEARRVIRNYYRLSGTEKQQLVAFLKSL